MLLSWWCLLHRSLLVPFTRILALPQIQSLFQVLVNDRHAHTHLDLAIYFLLLPQQLVASQIAGENLIPFIYLLGLVLVEVICSQILGDLFDASLGLTCFICWSLCEIVGLVDEVSHL